MRKAQTQVIFFIAVGFLLGALPSALSGRDLREGALTTGQVIAGATLPGNKGDLFYAEVRATALPELYDDFKAMLNRLGLVKWDARFDCNHLADLYVATAQAKFAVAAWNSNTKAETLALGVVWYSRDRAGTHALVEVRSDRGVLFVDPMAGPSPVELSPAEQRSISFRKW